MTARHHTPAYQRNARIVRQRARAVHRLGDDVQCWRCGGPIPPGMPFDVGHKDRDGGDHESNLAPEHRHGVPGCRGNRADGGAIGARITNGTRRPAARSTAQTWRL